MEETEREISFENINHSVFKLGMTTIDSPEKETRNLGLDLNHKKDGGNGLFFGHKKTMVLTGQFLPILSSQSLSP